MNLNTTKIGGLVSGKEFQVRNYQLEMLEQSLKGNVIIALDTGGGKTEIAVLRMRAELNNSATNKRIWFLAPTVALCEQQHKYIQSRLPDTSPLLLTGSSNLEYWSEQSIWDAALHNHRIIVSTHAVLLDALRHGFVRLASLALLIFDEAHHCTGNHPANLIMQRFYHEEQRTKGSTSVPNILGLSASPVQRSNIEEIYQIEKNLNSVCVIPRMYRQELLNHVHRPKFSMIKFSLHVQAVKPGSALCTLQNLHLQVTTDINDVLHQVTFQNSLVISPRPFDPHAKDRLVRTITQYRRKSEHVYAELGASATDYFIQKTNELCVGGPASVQGFNFHCGKLLEKVIGRYFRQSDPTHGTSPPLVNVASSLSDKANKLVDLIAQQALETTGVIFVKERVIVSILYQILSADPRTAKRFKFATFVGMSSNIKKKAGLHELLDLKSQNESLEAFRAKEKHIIIATDVLEEGIDVAACNLVVCFDPPTNMRSFIQRRGRARKKESFFVIMQLSESASVKVDRWAQLEEHITRICQEDERERQAALAAENQDEDLNLILRDKTTGAMLDGDAIKAHLHHFCNALPTQRFVETNPCFSIHCKGQKNKLGLVTAQVILPNCVGSLKRSYFAPGEYRTERAAFKAAAYECYRTLYEFGLVNNHFLPRDTALQDHFQDLEPLLEVDQPVQVRRLVALAWSSSELYKTTLQVESKSLGGVAAPRLSLITPIPISTMSFKTRSRHGDVVVKQISTADTKSSAINSEDLRRYKRKLAEFLLPRDLENNDAVEPDFVYVFDIDEWHGLFSCRLPVDLGEIMTVIVSQVEKFVTASLLQSSVFTACTFRDCNQLIAALTAPSADPKLNFERHEFLGDSILKLVISTHVFTERPTWPAGWLTQHRDNFISNGSLARAALSLHLDRYILTSAPKVNNWVLSRISDAAYLPQTRNISSKTLADVSQALFAAAYLDSGYSLARSCIKVFIPEIRSEPSTYEMPVGTGIPNRDADEIQKLIGYEFRNITVLLQALTHASCTSCGSEESYQRLAFLGDAVLGFIVTKTLFQNNEELSEGDMTKTRAAIMNSNMLGYICMTHSISRTIFNITTPTAGQCHKVQHSELMALWKYMRHESRELGEAQKSCIARYHNVRETLQQQFQHGRTYPWITLAKLQPEDFFSDLIQSVIGAIFVDSGENWSACKQFVDKIGISSHIQRMVQHDFDVAHPRSFLQQLAPLAEVQIQRTSDGSYRCMIIIDGIEVATAERCRSKNEAVILASHRATRQLDVLKKDFLK